MSERFEDTPGLFGEGSGHGTSGNCTCEWCGTNHSDREDASGEAIATDSIAVDNFGDLQILDCCFGKVEQAVLRNMDSILPWYIRLLKKRKETLEERFGDLDKLRKALGEIK